MSAEPEIREHVAIKLLLEDWLGDLRRKNCRPATLENYGFALADWRDRRVSDLAEPGGRRAVRAWLDRLAQTRAPKTVSHRIVSLKTFCHWLQEEGYLIDPFILEKGRFMIKLDEPEIEILTEAEIKALFRVARQKRRRWATRARSHRDSVLIRLLLLTGLRAGEVCAITPDDIVDGDRLEIHVSSKVAKGRRSRIVPILSADFGRELRRYARDRQLSDPDQPLFGMTTAGLGLRLRRLGREAGLTRNIHPHMFRHTFATNWLRENPGKLTILQRLLGHRNINTTMRYLHLVDDDVRQGWTLKDPGR